VRPRTLLAQLYSVYLVTITVSFVVLTTVSITSIRSQSISSIESELKDQAVVWRNISANPALSGSIYYLDDNLKEIANGSDTRVTIIDKDGQVLADSNYAISIMENHGNRPEIIQAKREEIGTAIRYSTTLGQEMLYVALLIKSPTGEILGVVRTAKSLISIQREMGDTLQRVGLFSILILVITSIVTWFTSNRITKQLSLLNKAAIAFSRRDFHPILPDKKTLEIAQLSQTIHKMATELNQGIITTERQKKELEAMLSSMVEAVILLDKDLKIKSLNPAAKSIFRLKEKAVRGLNLLEVFHSTELFNLAASTRAESYEEKDITIQGPPEQHFRVHSSLLTGENEKNIGVLLVMNNITRMKRLERMRKDFVANVSHELKTPITSIIGFVETLKGGAISDQERAVKFLGIVEKQSHRLASIVEDLLILSGIEQVEGAEIELQKFNLASSLNNCIQSCLPLGEKKNISITLQCDSQMKIRANSLLLEQAVQNLISNAVKYSPHESTVKITAEEANGDILIKVSDNGPGIPEQYQERIFERFFRIDKARSREVGGTGLGLAIVKHIAMVHGGGVKVISDEGSGSTFTLTIPYR